MPIDQKQLRQVKWDAPTIDSAAVKWDEPSKTPGVAGATGSGVLRGFNRAVDHAADWLTSILPNVPAYQQQGAKFKAFNEGLDEQNKDSTAYKVGDVGGQVLATLPVGGAVAAPIKALAAAGVAPRVLAPVADAVATGGMRAGGVTGKAGMATRAAGGGATGFASAGLVDPDSAATGGVIGAALPPALKAVGTTAHALGAGVRKGVPAALGMSTGAGAESVSQAFKAGKTGNKDFLANMRGDIALTDVLDRAKEGLATMAAERSARYRSGMVPITGDKTVLSFDGLDQALREAAEVTAFKGQVKNQSAAEAVRKMQAVVDEWRALAPDEFHTPEGLDALKQRLGAVLEEIPFEQRSARLAAGKVYNAAKTTIEAQAPTYARVMRDFSTASDEIREIERALSLGNKASADTAMRKLQSLMRNNVQTNYGNRLTLANTLEEKGGVDLLPSLAGQAMNSLTPRSLSGQIGGGATVAAATMANPWLIAGLPFQSPRLVGSMAYGTGRVAGLGETAIGKAISTAQRVAPNGAGPEAIDQLFPRTTPVRSLVYRGAPVAAADR